MVQNPIYESDGPVYDSVQPQFISQVTAATNTCVCLKHHDLEISTSQLTDKNRYVDQPSLIHSGSFSFSSNSIDHSCINGQLVSQDGGYSACTTYGNIFEDYTKDGVTLPSKLNNIAQ